MSKTYPELVRSQADELWTISLQGADQTRAKPERYPTGTNTEPSYPLENRSNSMENLRGPGFESNGRNFR
ncbi:hypothetical protein [Sphingobacterium endophyticum]|uniref:hypothetical protein n=1 Tax=Sphingobacterium endophyticum TaxID=2546448 RepID=UPI0012E32378|nr:hypothetical protein [Sphingobacterium endophyticum]